MFYIILYRIFEFIFEINSFIINNIKKKKTIKLKTKLNYLK